MEHLLSKEGTGEVRKECSPTAKWGLREAPKKKNLLILSVSAVLSLSLSNRREVGKRSLYYTPFPFPNHHDPHGKKGHRLIAIRV